MLYEVRPALIHRKSYEQCVLSDGGSADPALNFTLAAVLAKVKAAGVPKQNIEKAFAKVRLSGFRWRNRNLIICDRLLVVKMALVRAPWSLTRPWCQARSVFSCKAQFPNAVPK